MHIYISCIHVHIYKYIHAVHIHSIHMYPYYTHMCTHTRSTHSQHTCSTHPCTHICHRLALLHNCRQEFFSDLYHRFLLSPKSSMKSMCLQAMAIVYGQCYQEIGPFNDTPFMMHKLDQVGNQTWWLCDSTHFFPHTMYPNFPTTPTPPNGSVPRQD